MEKVAVVTGSSSGIGFETSLALAREGYFTYATMRDVKKAAEIQKITDEESLPLKIIELDVDNEESAENAINAIIQEKNRIDVLVNNAGWGIWGTGEDVSIEEFKAQFETNFFSVVRMIQKVAPTMRKQGSGNIVNISSVAGRIGLPASTAYVSSKFAVEGLSESLRYELGQFGINVIIIEPGVIKTNFFDSMKTAKKADVGETYRDITLKVITGVKMMAEMGTSPKEVAQVIINSLKEEKPLPRYIVGNDAAMFMESKKMKTDIEFENYMKKELYGE
ncbi:MAG: SDR family oxidoreductase [Candidatus Nitrosopelagicus sp.]|nr:SDR family oxidoreductase [Candidatus Nitrosopelagicus sp.]